MAKNPENIALQKIRPDVASMSQNGEISEKKAYIKPAQYTIKVW
jgi:hypothetical protein